MFQGKTKRAVRDLVVAVTCALLLLFALPLVIPSREWGYALLMVTWALPYLLIRGAWTGHFEFHSVPDEPRDPADLVLNLAFYALVIWCVLRAWHHARHPATADSSPSPSLRSGSGPE